MARICESAHCHSDAVVEVCKEVYGEDYANKPVASQDSQGACKCVCSCMAFDTQVAISSTETKSVQDIKQRTDSVSGDTVLVAGKNLNWVEKEVLFSGGTKPGTKQPNAIFIEFGNNEFMVCTGDHLFLMATKKVRMANRLATGDKLLRPDGNHVTIVSVRRGDYYGGFHHISTSRQDPKGSLENHLLVTAGVVTADYTAQLFKEQFLDLAEQSLPEVGSVAYEKKYSSSTPAVPLISLAGGKVLVARSSVASVIRDSQTKPVFVPAELTKVKIPPDACRFISDEEAIVKASDSLRSLDDTTSLDEANGLVFHTRAYQPYDDVVYHVDWYDNTVNAFAWVENGVRHVALKGGLLRHPAIFYQATALVLAHELGHHFGGQPNFPQGLSCEGRADFYGANIVMRKVWFGEFYVQLMNAAIQQLQNFFGPNPGNHGCSHPSRDCRMSIYTAALELRPIPACAFAT